MATNKVVMMRRHISQALRDYGASNGMVMAKCAAGYRAHSRPLILVVVVVVVVGVEDCGEWGSRCGIWQWHSNADDRVL
ncbi:hypothetical protein TcWFU_002560 [Taenia crassiceps]|uniref:Uncharacterized protein n=1 Tax=Taenia crassiceps TaxID=6207 RepID=A0ABR4Q3T8_9CEST